MTMILRFRRSPGAPGLVRIENIFRKIFEVGQATKLDRWFSLFLPPFRYLQMSMLFISTDGRMVFYFGRFSQSVRASCPLNLTSHCVIYAMSFGFIAKLVEYHTCDRGKNQFITPCSSRLQFRGTISNYITSFMLTCQAYSVN